MGDMEDIPFYPWRIRRYPILSKEDILRSMENIENIEDILRSMEDMEDILFFSVVDIEDMEDILFFSVVDILFFLSGRYR